MNDGINKFDIGDTVFYINRNRVESGMVWGKHFGSDYRKTTDIITYVMGDGVKISCHRVFSTRQEAIDSLVDIVSENK